jgi:hypothetical protein
MDGDKKAVLCVVALVCVTILYAFLFLSLNVIFVHIFSNYNAII